MEYDTTTPKLSFAEPVLTLGRWEYMTRNALLGLHPMRALLLARCDYTDNQRNWLPKVMGHAANIICDKSFVGSTGGDGHFPVFIQKDGFGQITGTKIRYYY